MKKTFTLAVAALAATMGAMASEAPADFRNLLGEGADYAALTVTWGDDLAVDNLVSAVRFTSGDATVGSILATALKDDPRFYALKDADGAFVAFGFDTDGDYSAAVTIGSDSPELVEGVATAEADADLSTALGSALYDHWKVNGEEGKWQLLLNGKAAALTDAVTDAAQIRLVYVEADADTPGAPAEVFYLRPATQRGAWMMPNITFDMANGKQQYFPMIANVIDRDDLYSGWIKVKVKGYEDTTSSSPLGEYSQYRYGTDGQNLRVRFTPTTSETFTVTPYVQTGEYKNETHYEADEPTTLTIKIATPVTGIRMEGWPAEAGETAEITLFDVVNFRAYAVPEDADFATVTYSIDTDDVEIFAKSSYAFDMFVTHKTGECTMTVTVPGTDIEEKYPVRIVDRDRENTPENYTDGTFWLSEEWFGHTNGSINYINPDYSLVTRAYEQQNPGESFGCTSQFGTIYADKLIITSKQHTDGGDSRTGGGRLVVADAKTLKKLAGFNYLGETESTTADGRAAVGVNPHKAYIGATSTIGVLDLDNLTYNPTGIKGLPTGGTSIYASQYGDMVCDGRYVYATRQSLGLIIIDTETDEVVKTLSNTNIQGVTRTYDGRVWMLDYGRVDGVYKSCVYSIDPETLEIADTFELPSSISCSWSTWRPTKFVAAKRSNKLIWSNNYVWDLDEDETPADVTPVITSADDRWPSVYEATGKDTKQGVYGSIAFDDRTNEILWAGYYGYGTDARFNWYNFTNIETGDIRSIRVLPDYYFFPALPIIPQKYRPALVNPDYSVNVSLQDEEPTVIDLTEVIDDLDNSPYHIRYSLVSEPAAMADTDDDDTTEPATVTLSGSTLTVTPVKSGSTTVKLTAESNGKEETISIPVKVTEEAAAVAAVNMDGKRFDYSDGILTLSGYEGVNVALYDTAGRMVKSFRPATSFFTTSLAGLPAGVYGLSAADGHRFKILVK